MKNTAPDEPEAYNYEDVRTAPVQLLPEPVNIPVVVPAAAFNWIDTDIEIEAGQSFDVVATGIVNVGVDCETRIHSIPGFEDFDCSVVINDPDGNWGIIQEVVPDYDQDKYPMLTAMHGSLVARIGESEPFFVGTGGTFIAESSGTLQFTVNDAPIHDDNDGEFIVIVEVDKG